MARGISIPFVLDPRQFIRGIRTIEVDLEGLQDSLKDVEKAGEGLDSIGDGLSDADRTFERVERSADDLADAFRDVGRKAETAFKDIRSDARRMDDGVSSSLRDVRDEAQDTGREMGASFSGSVDDIIDGFQEIAANATAKLGPIGGLIGIAAGTGIGFLYTKWSEIRDKIKEESADLFSGLIEALETDVGATLDDVFDEARTREWISANQDAFDKLINNTQALNAAQDEYEISARDVIDARQGEADALGRLTPILSGIVADGKTVKITSRGAVINYSEAAQKALALQRELGIGAGNSSKMEGSAENYAYWLDQANPPDLGQSVSQSQKMARYAEDFKRALDNAPREVQVRIRTVMTGSATGNALLNMPSPGGRARP